MRWTSMLRMSGSWRRIRREATRIPPRSDEKHLKSRIWLNVAGRVPAGWARVRSAKGSWKGGVFSVRNSRRGMRWRRMAIWAPFSVSGSCSPRRDAAAAKMVKSLWLCTVSSVSVLSHPSWREWMVLTSLSPPGESSVRSRSWREGGDAMLLFLITGDLYSTGWETTWRYWETRDMQARSVQGRYERTSIKISSGMLSRLVMLSVWSLIVMSKVIEVIYWRDSSSRDSLAGSSPAPQGLKVGTPPLETSTQQTN